MKFKVAIAAFFACSTLAPEDAFAFGKKPVKAVEPMKREETMVMNLNHGQGSTKFYILEGLRKTREMQHQILRAQRQVEATDANYAKARNRSDDRTMTGTVERFKEVQLTLSKLEQDLEAANAQLKADIQSTLLQH
jgi:hypothetical protein